MKRILCIVASWIILSASAWTQQPFVHPGGLHTKEDFERMRQKVTAREHPWVDGWNALLCDSKAQSGYQPKPNPHMGSRQNAQNDASAAYLNALRWRISGDTAHADCAARILNAWAGTVSETPRGPDQPGLSGIPIGSFALAAEVLRGYPGWSMDEQSRFKRMLVQYFYPVCHDFLLHHNGRNADYYWANWDTCNMRAIMAIGVFCDDRAKFDEAVIYFKEGAGMGAIRHAVPFLYPGGIGQWQESGRDQAHVMGGQGLLAEMCQVAWNQGLDLFGYDGNRLLAGAEYTAQYTLWKSVPYTFYNNSASANQYYISQNYHGRLAASHFELLYNHYSVLKGLEAPNVQLLAGLRRPEPGEVDVFGFGTLTYTLEAKASPLAAAPPPAPRQVTATPGIGRVSLRWPPSGAYNVHGYKVLRATSETGPYTSIHSTTIWTRPFYTDTQVKPGLAYFYTITALNNAGESRPSAPVHASPALGGPLPAGWNASSPAGAAFSDASDQSFLIPGSGRDFNGNFAATPAEGDFCLTARLVQRKGPVNMIGLAVRKQGGSSANSLDLTIGEAGSRETRFHIRLNGKMELRQGDDYTWLPVWFRLRRTGNEFTACQSSDGIEWFVVGSYKTAMHRTVSAGLLVSAGGHPPGMKQTNAAQGLFDHVTIEKEPPSPPPAPSLLTANDIGDGMVRLEWKNAPKSTQVGVKIEASINGAPFCEIADLPTAATHFENTGVDTPSALRYRLRAYNRGGYSGYTGIVQCGKGTIPLP